MAPMPRWCAATVVAWAVVLTLPWWAQRATMGAMGQETDTASQQENKQAFCCNNNDDNR